MSAIAGFLNFDARPAAGEDLVAMLDRMAAFRHADARSGWHGDVAALGLLLEHHTPEDLLERQPLPDPSGRFLLIGDLRLDNRAELAHVFRLSSAELARTPDSGLALLAWLRWRERAAEHLLGDFVFTVLDREARALYCARDHVGVRPLYFTQTPQRFAFASAIKGLFALEDVPRVIDEQGFADFLVLLADDLQRTCWSGIQRLPAGHWMAISGAGRVHLERYWHPENVRELRLGSDDAYTEALKEAMTRAVVPRMRSLHPHGVLLSGGLDSSTVACYAADEALVRGERLTAASSVLPDGWTGPERDEWAWIKLVADSRTNIDVIRVSAPGLGILDGLDEMLAINDQPFRDLFHYKTRALFEALAARGVRNVLGGFGGDSVVSSHGRGFMVELLLTGRLTLLAREIRAIRARTGASPAAIFVNRVMRPLVRRTLLHASRSYRARMVRQVLSRSPISEAFAKATDLVRRLEKGVMSLAPISVLESEKSGLHTRHLADELEFSAHVGAAFRLRESEPLLDARLLERALSVRADIKVLEGVPRHLIRRIGRDAIPDMVRHRQDKGPFEPSFVSRLDPTALSAFIQEASRSAGRIDESKARMRVASLQMEGHKKLRKSAEALSGSLGLVAGRFLSGIE